MQTSTKINIPKHINIGRLIGRDGRNLKPIAEITGTHISVNTITTTPHFEIRINNNSTLPSSKDRIREASNKLEDLLKTKGLEMQSLPKKKKKKVIVNHHKYNDLEKERKFSERGMKHMIKSHIETHSHDVRGPHNKQKAKRKAPLSEY